MDTGHAGGYLALLYYWPVRFAAAAHDRVYYDPEPRLDLGDVLDFGCDRGAAGHHGRSRRGVLMCAAVIAERTEATAAAPTRASEPVVRIDGLSHYFGEGGARNQVLFNNCIEIPPAQLV